MLHFFPVRTCKHIWPFLSLDFLHVFLYISISQPFSIRLIFFSKNFDIGYIVESKLFEKIIEIIGIFF